MQLFWSIFINSKAFCKVKLILNPYCKYWRWNYNNNWHGYIYTAQKYSKFSHKREIFFKWIMFTIDQKICIGRESNPGRPRGRRAFNHWTTDACEHCTWSRLFSPVEAITTKRQPSTGGNDLRTCIVLELKETFGNSEWFRWGYIAQARVKAADILAPVFFLVGGGGGQVGDEKPFFLG